MRIENVEGKRARELEAVVIAMNIVLNDIIRKANIINDTAARIYTIIKRPK